MTSTGVWIRATHNPTRIIICLLGLAAIAWGVFELPLFWQEATPRSVASRLLQGYTFKTQLLLSEAQQAEDADRQPFCNPTTLRSLATLRLFIYNESIAAANQALVESSYDPVYDAARKALTCAPTDSFLWLTLFWLDGIKHGLEQNNANYLRLSYALGPNEAWIALWRIRLAFQLFEKLPPDLSADAIDEFVMLVKTGQLYWQTAGMFRDAPPVIQNRIVEQLKTSKVTFRRAFARTLHDRGVDVIIPGVETPDVRPWR
jgi:hypothetical protein